MKRKRFGHVLHNECSRDLIKVARRLLRFDAFAWRFPRTRGNKFHSRVKLIKARLIRARTLFHHLLVDENRSIRFLEEGRKGGLRRDFKFTLPLFYDAITRV